MRRGLGARLAIAFALLAGLTAFVTAGVSSVSTSQQVKSDVDRFLEDRAGDIAEGRRLGAAGQFLNNGDRGRSPRRPAKGDENDTNVENAEVLDEILELVESDAEVQILDENGDIMVTAGVVLPVEEVDLAFLPSRSPPLLRTVTIDGEKFRMITRHFDGGGAVQVAQSLRGTNALLGNLRTKLMLVGLAMSGLAGLVGWGVASRTTKPLRKLTASVEAIAATQDLSTPIVLDRSDEIGRLSEEFETLLQTLGASRDQQHQLVQDAAHELRTPLTSVRANIDFLERADDLDAETRQSTLLSIKSELGELSSILAEVVELATASRDRAGFERLDLVGVAEAALAQFELRSARPVNRDLVASEVLGDHTTLVRAVSNLVGNADKYSPAGEPILVRVRDGSLSVSDRGPGISVKDRPRVFDRFYRSDTARSAPGSGLGLAIVAKAVEEHGGEVWVRDAPTGGAVVGFTLPQLK